MKYLETIAKMLSDSAIEHIAEQSGTVVGEVRLALELGSPIVTQNFNALLVQGTEAAHRLALAGRARSV